jgi:hypothetical protein
MGGKRVATGFIPSRADRWTPRTALSAVGLSVLLMVGVGVQGPSVAVVGVRSTSFWPPWSGDVHPSAALVSTELWLALLLGGAGLVLGLIAVRHGWRPRIRRLIAGSVLMVAALLVIPPVGSADMLLYVISGRIVALGDSPYTMTPAQLKASGDPVGVAVVHAYANDPTRYGPVETAIEGLTSELTGTSVGRDIFLLKVLNGLAYLGVVLVLDRLARSDTARRVRTHLLWSLNPLMLWAAMAGGHNDVLGAFIGIAALFVMRRVTFCTAMLSGVLLGLSVDIKAPYALFGAGLAWTARRSPLALAALPFGAVAVLIPAYLVAGRAAITALLGVGSGAPDGIWYFAARVLRWQHGAGTIDTLGLVGCLALAVILFWRMPAGPCDLPAVRVALGAMLAFLIVSPQQKPWYDVMIFPLLALIPATRLDWIVVARGIAGAVGGLPRFFYVDFHPGWLSAAVRISSAGLIPIILVMCIAVLLWLCATNRWTPAPAPESGRFEGRPELRAEISP